MFNFFNPNVTVNVRPALEVRVRRQVLHDVVLELIEMFGGADPREVLQKGIVEKPCLDGVILQYLNPQGKLVGNITVEIDWERHHVFAVGEHGRFQIDPSRPVHEQISQVFSVFNEHVAYLRQYHSVRKVLTTYRYVPEVREDPAKLDEVRTFLSTKRRSIDWAEETETERYEEATFTPGKLKELTLRMSFLRPQELDALE